jgi:hypothetical protein
MHFYMVNWPYQEKEIVFSERKSCEGGLDLYLTLTDDSGHYPQKNIIYLGITIMIYILFYTQMEV